MKTTKEKPTAANTTSIKKSKLQNTGPDYISSPLEIACKLIPEDLDFLVNVAKENEIPLPIVAGVVASMGEALIRLPLSQIIAPMQYDATNYVWMVINRELSDYTADASIFIDQDYLYMTEMDCESMKRTPGDWLASLVHVGIHLMKCEQARQQHCGYGGVSTQLQSLAYLAMKQGGPVIKASLAILKTEVAA